MSQTLSQCFEDATGGLRASDEQYAPQFVEVVLRLAREHGASDVHLVPTPDGLHMAWRVDGVLQPVATLREAGPNIVSRLKVLAELLTYRTDIPQEGRIRTRDTAVEMRLSTFPTMFGEKAVVRLFVGSGRFLHLEDLGLSDDLLPQWRRLLTATSGVLIISGPAGSGKTTTLYASLRDIMATATEQRSMVSLEDPIEAVVPGVAQSQINAPAGFDYARGLRSLLRQDPEIIMVGEIRDRVTAETVFQASLTGQLVLTSFHAGSAADAVSRLCDMDIEPYLLRSGLIGLLSQRLLRRLCPCAIPGDDPTDRLDLPVESWKTPAGCEDCRQTGYRGRMLLAELLLPETTELGRKILSKNDASRIEQAAVAAGMRRLQQQACKAVSRGETSPAEVRRTWGSPR